MGMVEYIDMKLWKEYEVKHEKWVLYYTYSETYKSMENMKSNSIINIIIRLNAKNECQHTKQFQNSYLTTVPWKRSCVK